MASVDLRKELECAICLNIYTDPVIINECGHKFCRGCIVRVLHTQVGSGIYICPKCKQTFRGWPNLHKDIRHCNLMDKSAANREMRGVFCTYCIDTPVHAIKSCLLCEASLCEKHLKVHSKSPEHILSKPTTSLKNRKCSIHNKVLEYYCTEDLACICVSCCLVGEHKGHQMESLEEASERSKNNIKNNLQKLKTKKEETEKKVQSLKESKQELQDQVTRETEKVNAFFSDIRQQLDNLEKKIINEISRQTHWLSISDLIQKLEMEKDKLSKKMLGMEELFNVSDPLTILQELDISEVCKPKEDDEDSDKNELLQDGDVDMTRISHTLYTGLSDILTAVNGGISITEPEDLLLDETTAGNYIYISDDLKTATRSDVDLNCADLPERFQYIPQVLSRQTFSTGQHYWEVDVRRSEKWRVGLCYPSIDRKAYPHSMIGYNNRSWSLNWNGTQCVESHDNKGYGLPEDISVNRLRIYLDYEAGQISFYELSIPIQHLCTFSATFTEPLHAALGIWEGSLKICGGDPADEIASSEDWEPPIEEESD